VFGNNSGGGVYCFGSYATIEGNIMTGDTADDGGGIYCESGGPTIQNILITNNIYSVIRCLQSNTISNRQRVGSR